MSNKKSGKLMFTIGIILIPILLIVGGCYGYRYLTSSHNYDMDCLEDVVLDNCGDSYSKLKYTNGVWKFQCTKGGKLYSLSQVDMNLCREGL